LSLEAAMAHDGGMLPLWIKIAYTLFVIVLVPVYWVHYGPANFLWFSDIALFTTVAALWLESRFLASTMAVGVLLLELTWNIDFFVRLLTGAEWVGLAGYMFDSSKPRSLRGLSFFHILLPILLVWMVARLGYNRRALPAQTLLAWLVLPVSYFFTDPAKNINWVFGPGSEPQRSMPSILYLAILMAFLPLTVYLPTHLLLAKLFGTASRT
jgi:hypothetical protein